MERHPTVHRARAFLMFAALACAMLATVAPAQGAIAGITLSRSPAPPQAIKPGQVETISYTVSYETRGISVSVKVKDPNGGLILQRIDPINDTAAPPAGSPRSYTAPTPILFTPAPSAPVGRYRVEVEFTSDIGLESNAATTFDVAAELGGLRVTSYEDLNGDGLRQAGETGLQGFIFRTENPFGFPSEMTTDIAGSKEVTNVPAGSPWNVSETQQAGWTASSATSAVVTVPANNIAEFAVGHYKPGAVSGTVFVDTNKSATRDAGEAGRAGATLTLTGANGKGQAVTLRTTTSGADGSYRFDDLAPGTYTVTFTTPSGFTLTTTQTVTGVGVVSRGERPNVDFGIVAGSTTNPPGGDPPGSNPPGTRVGDPDVAALSVRKVGPARARGGQLVRYTIRVTNTGRGLARQVVVTDTVPNLMTLVRTPVGATVANGVVSWRLGDLAAGRSRTLAMQVRLARGAPPGVYANTATATSLNTTPVSSRTSLRVTVPPRTPTGGVTG